LSTFERKLFSRHSYAPNCGEPCSARSRRLRVERAFLEIDLKDGQDREVPLVQAPGQVDAKYFVVWPPNGAQGRIVAYGASGEVLAGRIFCVGGY